MPELIRPRPILATIICVYEGIIFVFGLFAIGLGAAARTLSSAAGAVHTPFLTTALSWLGYLLALGIVITLWQMQRAAFYLAATRLALGLIGLVYYFLVPTPMPTLNQPAGAPQINMHAVAAFGIVVGVIFLAINAAITFYVENITRPVVYSTEPPVL